MMIEIVILSELNLKCIKNIIFFFFINSNIFQGDVWCAMVKNFL